MLPLKRFWLLSIKLIVTIGLVAVLLSNADWSAVFGQARQIHIMLILATFAILTLSVTISAYKWQLFLSIHGLKYNFSRLHRYYFIAMYINNFLPTSIGGDGYRVYKTLDNNRSRSSALIAVIMERVTGLSALLILAYVSAIYLFVIKRDPIAINFIIFCTASGAGVVIAYLVFPSRYMHRLKDRFARLSGVLDTISSHLDDYVSHWGLTVKVIVVSFLFHLHLCLAYVLLLNVGLDLSVTLPELFVVLAAVGLISVLPISINGIGVVEGTFIFLIGQFDVGYDDALMVALLLRLLVIPISIIGAVFYLAGDSRLSDESAISLSSAPEDRKQTGHQ